MKYIIWVLSISMFFINVAQANNVNDCLRTSFMDRDISTFSLGVIKNEGEDKYIYKQSSSCPFDSDCKKGYSLNPSEDVVVSHTKDGWSCSWYKQVIKGGKIRKRIGWIDSKLISPKPSLQLTDQRIGSWIKIFGSGAFSVTKHRNEYSFRGKATFRKKGKKIITEIAGDGVVVDSFLKFQNNDDHNCSLNFMPLGHHYAIINGLENCGSDTGFKGVYERTANKVSYGGYLSPMDIYNKLDLSSFNHSLFPSLNSKSNTYLKSFFKIKDISETVLVLEGGDRYWIIESLSNNRIRIHDKIMNGTYDKTDIYETITSDSAIKVKSL